MTSKSSRRRIASVGFSQAACLRGLSISLATNKYRFEVYIRYNNYTMEFEFDLGKSTSNDKKHGIVFLEAQALWDDPDFVEIPLKTVDEPRFLVIGKISEKHWSAIITYRSEKVRIISVRRSRKEEVEIYES
ncbi:MAG TPA: BrnT family toxin [Candidatus Sulfobium mesophilum]|nr:BrnT family toxin [Candidatus Sulfobium mesophilum]